MVHKEILFIIKLLKGGSRSRSALDVEGNAFFFTLVVLFFDHLYLCFVQVEVSSGGC